MNAADLATLNALIAATVRKAQRAGDGRGLEAIVDEALALADMPRIGRALYRLRARLGHAYPQTPISEDRR